jgi:Yip1 domain
MIQVEVYKLMTFQEFWDLCKTIWTQPRQTIQRALQNETKIPFILIMFFGIGLFLDFTSNRNYGDNTPINVLFLLSFIIGPIIGFIGWMVTSGSIYLTTKIFGGVGDWKDTRNAVAWATIPYLTKLLFWFPQLLFFGSELFTEETPILSSNLFLLIVFFIFELIEFVLLIWFYVVLCKCIAEVQDFSGWKGFASVFSLPILLFVLLVVVSSMG